MKPYYNLIDEVHFISDILSCISILIEEDVILDNGVLSGAVMGAAELALRVSADLADAEHTNTTLCAYSQNAQK